MWPDGQRPNRRAKGDTPLASEGITVEQQTWTLPTWLRGLSTLALVAGALALLAFGWMRSGSPLVVVVDGHRYQVRTHATTVGDALRQAGFELYPEDRVSPGRETVLQSDMVIQVRRARPVTLSADGQVRQLRTQAETVGELLQEAGVQLGPADEIWLRGNLVQVNAPLDDGTLMPRQVSYRGGARLPLDADAHNAADPPLVALRRAASLTLDDGGTAMTLYTTATTVGQVLQQHGVSLFLGDQVIPGLQNRVTSGMTVTIQRSVPVRIKVDGHTIRTRTRAENVAGVLGQEGIALLGKDTVKPGLNDPILPNAFVRITRVREDLAVEFDPIPFETVWVPDPGVEIDATRLLQKGEIGLTKRRYRVVYEDDQEADRFLEDAWTEQPPITKTLAYGTKIVVRTLQTADGPIEYWRKMRVYTTSYRPASCGKLKTDPRYGYTRLGWELHKGVVAVDPAVIPLKTSMYVPGYGFAVAADTGGGVKGKFVDLGFSDTDYQSWHWWTDIYLLTPVPPSSQIRWILPDYPRFPDRKRR
jgi:uncharacterized protein YabE (DUF348 family)